MLFSHPKRPKFSWIGFEVSRDVNSLLYRELTGKIYFLEDVKGSEAPYTCCYTVIVEFLECKINREFIKINRELYGH